ncbi:SMP-30/gluconolactonase/LRE family protein [Leifsonia sp. NPDC058248]|uniref:SMP-30/gluconolactonase/LRE family protein n=1 Tax=Leifsonia sp. NPDC058248 TaxID=3346402 RepID=UPI0036DEC15A
MTRVKQYPAPEVVVRAQAAVGEGPVIDERSGRLCWVDIENGLLFETDLESGTTTSTPTGTTLGAALPRETNPGFAVAVADGFGILDDGGLSIIDPVLPEPYRRMNDAACDSRGRLWAGSTHREFVPGVGALHRWDGAGPSEIVATGLTLPNGIGWSPDDTRLYLADSMTHELLVAGYTAESGEIGEFETLCRIEAGLPDGLAVGADGCVWIAVWGASVVQRYTPAGELIGECALPVTQVSSCAFGHDGTLYITSARSGLTEKELRAQPLAGSVFAVATDTGGAPVHAFAG